MLLVQVATTIVFKATKRFCVLHTKYNGGYYMLYLFRLLCIDLYRVVVHHI